MKKNMKKVLFWTLYPFYVISMLVLGAFYIVGYYCEKLADLLYEEFYSLY